MAFITIEEAVGNGLEFRAHDEESDQYREVWDYLEVPDGYEISHAGKETFIVKRGAKVFVTKRELIDAGLIDE